MPPDLLPDLFPYIYIPSLVAEVSLALWLAVAGVNVAQWNSVRGVRETVANP